MRGITILALILLASSTASAREPADASIDLSAYANQQARAAQDTHRAVAVALSGGGLRAANFALGVLLALEQQGTANGNALAEVDYFSTASGGGFAAAAYLATRYDAREHPRTASDDYRLAEALSQRPELLIALRGGYAAMATASGCHTFLPSRDRGHGLEKLLNDRLLAAASQDVAEGKHTLVLADLFWPADRTVVPARLLPYWVANATSGDSGGLFPFAPDVVRRAHLSGFVHRCADEVIQDGDALPWSVALKASSSLPGLVPASIFTTTTAGETVRLVDGGVSDNLGIITALEMLVQDKTPTSPDVPRKLLLIVDAYRGDGEPMTSTQDSARVALLEAGWTIALMKAAQRLNYERLVRPLAEARGIEVVRIAIGTIPDAELQERVSAVATDLSISEEEQQLLHKAGALALATERERLLSFFARP